MSNLCNIIQILNEYQLDIQIDFIYKQSKLVLKKKPLEFLAKVIVPKSLSEQQHSSNKPKSNIEQQQQQQQNSPKDNQLNSFSLLSFFSSFTNSNSNTPDRKSVV